MTAKVHSCVVSGVAALPVEVEVDVAGGLPQFILVGLPDGAVREARDRVRAALRNAGYDIGAHRITVNLAPADLRKVGATFDLAIALGILEALGHLPEGCLRDVLVAAELSLDGRLKPIHGALPAALGAQRANLGQAIVPHENADEAALAGSLVVRGAEDLREVARHLRGETVLEARSVDGASLLRAARGRDQPDLSEVRGQSAAKRALEVAAAGGHNLLLIGPPGSGKTMLARRLPGILPDLTLAEALESTAVHSVAGLLGGRVLLATPPLRAPHHTASRASLLGGGRPIHPGEVALAHRGVLFLDELPEFPVGVLESLRQPLEERRLVITRVAQSCEFPADILLACAMNPCPCGHAGDPKHLCTCPPQAAERYRRRLSGPLLDRIDLHVEVPALPRDELFQPARAESSVVVRKRVLEARQRQRARLGRTTGATNASMTPSEIDRHCRLDASSQGLLEAGLEHLGLSARAYTRVLRVARTLADLAARDDVRPEDVAEALQYRSLDRRTAPRGT